MRQIAVQSTKGRALLQPVSRSTDFESAYSSMRNSKWVCFNVRFGVNGGSAVVATLMQAKNVAGAAEKELIFRTGLVFKQNSAATGSDADKWTEVTVTTSDATGSNVSIAGEDGYSYKFYVHNDMLDADNDFDCVAIRLTALSSTLVEVDIEFEEPRFSGDPNEPLITPSAALDGGDQFGN